MALRTRIGSITLATALAGGCATALVAALPNVRLAFGDASAHLAMETGIVIVALFAAFLVWGRYTQTRALGDLVLASSLALTAGANLVLAQLPSLSDDASFSPWPPLALRVLATGLFATAAVLPRRPLRRPRRAQLVAAGLLAASVAGAVALGFTLGASLPRPVEAAVMAEATAHPVLTGHPVLQASDALVALLFVVAAVGFARQARHGEGGLIPWLAPAAVLGALSRVNYMLLPSLHSEFVALGDLFRLALYAVVLVGAAAVIRGTWHRLAELAVLEERRRVARDLHDGLSQELAYIAAHARELPRGGDVAGAAERALVESRRAIVALTRPLDEPLHAAVAEAAEEAARRTGGRVELELESGADVPLATREALVRIAGEAVANAIRHGRPQRVRVGLTSGPPLRLSVRDDGCGFGGEGSRGFGITSMRERAQAIGGSFAISPAEGGGTRVEVVVP